MSFKPTDHLDAAVALNYNGLWVLLVDDSTGTIEVTFSIGSSRGVGGSITIYIRLLGDADS